MAQRLRVRLLSIKVLSIDPSPFFPATEGIPPKDLYQPGAQPRVNLASARLQKGSGPPDFELAISRRLQDQYRLPVVLPPLLLSDNGLIQPRDRQHVDYAADDKADPKRVKRALPPPRDHRIRQIQADDADHDQAKPGPPDQPLARKQHPQTPRHLPEPSPLSIRAPVPYQATFAFATMRRSRSS